MGSGRRLNGLREPPLRSIALLVSSNGGNRLALARAEKSGLAHKPGPLCPLNCMTRPNRGPAGLPGYRPQCFFAPAKKHNGIRYLRMPSFSTSFL